jgi:hypothetical protein
MPEQTEYEYKKTPGEISFWFSSTLLFLIIFSTNSRILKWLDLGSTVHIFGNSVSTIRELIAPIRGGIFLFTLAALLWPLLYDLQKGRQKIIQPPPWTTISAFLAMSLLIIPQGLQGLGQEYGSQSILIFDRASTVASYQRFLMPALGYITFLRGSVFFFIFSLACTFGLIYLTHTWFTNNNIHVPIWGFISILTSSFVAAQYQLPGYPDSLVFIFLLIIAIFPISDLSKLTLIVLSIAAHEASVILYGFFAPFLFGKERLAKPYGLLGLYMFIWLGSNRFSLTELMNSRPQPSTTVNMTSIEWLLNNPVREILGIFFAYKLLWLLIIWAVILLLKKRNFRMAIQVIALLVAGIVMTLFAIDTSRLIGWSFYALLFSIGTLYQENKSSSQKIAKAIFLVNLLIPAMYVGLNLGMFLPPGIYFQLWRLKNWILPF